MNGDFLSKLSSRRCPDPLIKLFGAILIAACGYALHSLSIRLSTPPAHEAAPVELLLGALVFLSGSVGSLLLSLGGHCYDRAEISRRWHSRLTTLATDERDPAG